MTINEEIIAEARSWIGTRWMHGQCVKGYRTDCIRFIVEVGKKFGWVPEDYKPPVYRRDWALHNNESIMIKELSKFCEKVDNLRLVEIGDILVFKTGACAAHAGIYIGEDRMVEANIRSGVQEASIENTKGFHSAWRAKVLCG
ncbi:MAG: NlpC/P60 family protein [Planctomycetota bacterium]|jgi:NlpC/P60 family putative phage cell wall peptidase